MRREETAPEGVLITKFLPRTRIQPSANPVEAAGSGLGAPGSVRPGRWCLAGRQPAGYGGDAL